MPSPPDSNAPQPQRLDDVLALFAQYQRRLYGFIASMAPDPADTDEILHETNIVVWKKFEQFQAGTDFRAWVFQIAYFEVRKHQQRKQRAGQNFSSEMLDELADEYRRQEDALERRRELLAGCVEKLRSDDRELVDRVYGQGQEVPRLAAQMGRQATSIYRSLRRIRQLLLDCVERTLAAEGAT